MSDHARLSPSSRHRWGACPGSVREEAAYPNDEWSSPAAIDGTHSHTLLSHCLNNSIYAADMVGQKLSDQDGEFAVDKDRAERVDFALAYLEGKEGVIRSECKVDPVTYLGRADLKGTVDIQIIGKTSLEIIDLKDGMNPVDAKDNPQMEVYGFGVLAEHCICGAVPFETVTLTIIQPKLRLKGMTGVSSHTYSIAEFIAKGQKIIDEAAATDAPDAPLVPGEIQCKYCKHKACTAKVNSALAFSGIVFEDISQKFADKEPTSLTDDQIKEIVEAAPLIRQMIEGVEAEALRRFETGHPVPGLKAVHGRGSSSWTIENDEEMSEKLKKFGIPKTALWKTSLISPAQAKKVTWEKRDGTKVQLTDRQLKTLETEYIRKNEGKLTIVPESDARKSVTISAAGMFAPVLSEPSLPSFLLPLN